MMPFYNYFVEEEIVETIVIEPSWIGWMLGEKPKTVLKVIPKEKNWIQNLLSWDEENANPTENPNPDSSTDAIFEDTIDLKLCYNIFPMILTVLAVCFAVVTACR